MCVRTMSDNVVEIPPAPGSPTEADAARTEDLMRQQNIIAKANLGVYKRKGHCRGNQDRTLTRRIILVGSRQEKRKQ